MKIDSKDYQLLRDAVEKTAGFSLKTHKDYIHLSELIFRATRCTISSSTLKRFWGAMDACEESNIRETTLDILANFIGYHAWQYFLSEYKTASEKNSSSMININKIETRSLKSGQKNHSSLAS